MPTFDYTTARGAVEALRNPNLAVRFKAWTALHQMGADAEDELLKLFADLNPRLRARALWLLGKITGRGEFYVDQAISDENPDIRITGIRLAKQLGMTPSVVCANLAGDESPAVRRELAIALRFDKSPTMPAVWARLATAHDGKDRWYLEALGIGSDLRADECYAAWLAAVGGRWDTLPGRDIAWRTRASQAAETLVSIIANEESNLDETNRYFRALEYHDDKVRTASMQSLLNLSDEIVIRAVDRMTRF